MGLQKWDEMYREWTSYRFLKQIYPNASYLNSWVRFITFRMLSFSIYCHFKQGKLILCISLVWLYIKINVKKFSIFTSKMWHFSFASLQLYCKIFMSFYFRLKITNERHYFSFIALKIAQKFSVKFIWLFFTKFG